MKTNIHTPEPQASTLSGELSLLDPYPAKISIEDIITALGHQVRYAGHTTEPVTVLQHSVHVWLLARYRNVGFPIQRQALWHDAAEAYLLDIPRPLKRLLGKPYADLELRFNEAIGQRLNVDLLNLPSTVKQCDTHALAAECALWRPPAAYADWNGLPTPSELSLKLAGVARFISRKPDAVAFIERCLRMYYARDLENFIQRSWTEMLIEENR